MGILQFTYAEKDDGLEGIDYCLPSDEFNRFNASILDLGDVSKDGQYFEALAAVFDLEGFTSFCNQIDPHLVIPDYLNQFLNWLFQSLSKEFVQSKDIDQTVLWCKLPFYAKFLGDGVLFLWDTRRLEPQFMGNIVVSLLNICRDYTKVFLPYVKKSVSRAPLKLRCGIARGQIISVGDGRDFVGPCINVASRLQKIGQFSFAFSKRGFNLEKCFSENYQNQFTLIKSSIRGVGDEELLFVQNNELELLPDAEKSLLLP